MMAVAAVRPTQEIRKAADVAAADFNQRCNDTISAAAQATDFADFETTIAAVNHAESVAPQPTALNDSHIGTRGETGSFTIYNFPGDFDHDAAWRAIALDCALIERGEDPFRTPLWPDGLPSGFPDPLPHLAWRGQGPGWDFWADWYEGYLTGHPLNIDLLEQIALIPPEDWDRGDAHVNGIIDDIRLKYFIDHTPLGEDDIEQGSDGIWRRVAPSPVDRDILRDAIGRVADTVAEIRAAIVGGRGNMFAALTSDLDRLEDHLARHADKPLRLHDTFVRVRIHIAGALASGELPEDNLVNDLAGDLGTSALDLLNADPKAREVVAARAARRVADLTPEQATQFVALSDAAATLADRELAQELKEDGRAAVAPETPADERKEAAYRQTGRLARIFAGGKNVFAALGVLNTLHGGVNVFCSILTFILSFVL